jgi:pimeloyl-ACP methyl ester carboxylesterase
VPPSLKLKGRQHDRDSLRQEYTVAGFVDDVAWHCRVLGLKRPIVVGHSMGGNIALGLAARHPDLPSAIVMIDSVLFPGPELVPSIRSLDKALRGTSYMASLGHAQSPLFSPATIRR